MCVSYLSSSFPVLPEKKATSKFDLFMKEAEMMKNFQTKISIRRISPAAHDVQQLLQCKHQGEDGEIDKLFN